MYFFEWCLTTFLIGGIAGTHDPNYQTLAGIGGDAFGADKKAAEGEKKGDDKPKAPTNQQDKAGTHDPN